MTTSRSESIKKSLEGHTMIRPISIESEQKNRIDHYAVLSQIMQAGIDTYLDNPEAQQKTHQAHSLRELESTLRTDIHQSIITTLMSDAYIDHRSSLDNSQRQRAEVGSRWSDVSSNILAGTGTFISVTSSVFHILQSRLGVEAASHEGNWRIIDRIAKLNLPAFGAFQETYLHASQFRNWSAFIEQLEVSRDDHIQFKPGYPHNAPIQNGLLKDVDGFSNDAIGCPVTFRADTIARLWGVYAAEAQRILTTPVTTDDTVASPR